ncbi:family 78 glycoside hydrolase catalytic domain [Streptococcus ovuberis]|uniref:alpha-L-rhamnosidase n=1 Tax=Streptococcus ovuberis TaxID=1936207 RepID=A0A7X6MX55_9STRE|nr:family 78 glycoside hydrolase catalytic domain [Streptococcus ovuberis]NKZ20007.1 family 78 glycoside hydrolase catalytic domain [Streptococcus ovuberis]
MKLYDVTIDYQQEPLGLAVRQPRFSWKLSTDQENTVQTSYQITVRKGDIPVWETGKVVSDQSILVEYAGQALKDETEYQVTITVSNNHGQSAEAITNFTTGIFDPEDFVAEMIGHNFDESVIAPPIFKKSFTVNKTIKKATVYVTAQGVYELELNGQKVGEDYLAPGWTSYHKRLQYQIYDVTEQLIEQNELAITVGQGWYAGIMGFEMKNHHYGDCVGALLQLNLTYEDGTKETIATDETWSVETGAIQSSEIYLGETINTFDHSKQSGEVTVLPFDKSILVAQENEPIRMTERLEVVDDFVTPAGERVLDFGQNMTGWVELRVKGRPGQKLIIEHAETLDKDGNFYKETLRQAISVDTYICDGTEQVFRPHFTFHGFRYIRLSGFEDTEATFIACVLHSDMTPTGTFTTSNPKINQLQSNIRWGQRGNFLDVPTDCPQRDERLGWTGDAQVFSWTAAYNYNVAPFFSKWMKDVAADSSLEKGVPHVVPDILGSYSSSAWSDVAVIVPWVIYQTYGDLRILEESWQVMHEWVDYITNHTGDNGLWMTGFQYGDWLALDKEESADRTGATDKYLIANAYYLYVTDLVRQTALLLSKDKEAERYAQLYEEVLAAFQDEYYTKTGRIVSETQTGAILSLHFNLARPEDRERIMKTLVTNIENHKNHLATGFVGTPYINHVLSENGAHDLAGILLMREDYPSWLYAVNMGATTIWERWNSIKPDGSFDESGMNSLNHYAYGSIGDWMYRKVAGIYQTSPGYKTFAVQPRFVKGIDEVTATLETPYGEIASHWICRGGRIVVEVTVPANTTAQLYLPEKDEVVELGSGTYRYEYDTATDLTLARFSLDCTFGEILDQPLAIDLFNQMAPGMLDNPMIDMARGMTLVEVLGAAPEARPLYEAVIDALNQEEGEGVR